MLKDIEHLSYQYHKPKYAIWIYRNDCRGSTKPEETFTKVFALKHFHKLKKLRDKITNYACVNDLIVDVKIRRRSNYYEYIISDHTRNIIGKYIDKGTIMLCPID